MANELNIHNSHTMDKKAIYNTKKQLINKNLGGALNAISPLLNLHAYAGLHERISTIRDDYQRMLSYMRLGYPDPSRNQLYLSLLRKLDRITNDAALLQRTQDMRNSFGSTPGLSHTTIAEQLQDYVSEKALDSLGMSSRESKSIHAEHHKFISNLFNSICYSGQWHRDDMDFYNSLLLSPTIDSIDSALIVSAITLSSITYFDIRKYSTLAHVYQHASDERLRQRALVGWALTTTRTHNFYPEAREIMEAMTSDSDTTRQLLELQMQMFFCMNAERDNDEIARDIIPNLMKNKGFEITRHGIVEKEDDPMQDILDPDASDKSMEEMERSFERMAEMQRSGSDVYFGGFRQMKRFPFFYTLCNWFHPFHIDHPGISQTKEKMGDSKFLEMLMKNGPFCDSDKYSFAIAINSVVDKLPESMKNAINEGASFGPMATEEMLSSSTNIRLMYLQDLYRFFRICDKRTDFYNPFGGENSQNALFYAYAIYDGALPKDDILKLGNFLLKRKQLDSLERLLACTPSLAQSPHHDFLLAHCEMNKGNYANALRLFESTVSSLPENKRALSAMGRAAMLAEDYSQAEKCYKQLTCLAPDNNNHALNLAIALIKNGKAQEATPLLFKLNYEAPNNPNTQRTLAWALLACKKTEQAIQEYKRLLSSGKDKAEDHLNLGYCHWANGNLKEAIACFTQFVEMGKGISMHTLTEEFEKDHEVLQIFGITPFEMNMMADLINSTKS